MILTTARPDPPTKDPDLAQWHNEGRVVYSDQTKIATATNLKRARRIVRDHNAALIV